MSNQYCDEIIENANNEACDATHLSLAHQIHGIRETFHINDGIDDFASDRNAESFLNGDLIDLCDRSNSKHDHGNLNVNLVEAINSQLLADINSKQHLENMSYDHDDDDDNNRNGSKKRRLENVALVAYSSDSIGKCSARNATSNEQHQKVIREFKRLGTYCTLRPEQRRKHLLKVLPTLRNSMLLQTLLASNVNTKNPLKMHATDDISAPINPITTAIPPTASTTNNDIDSLLIDLDDFIIDGNTAMMQRMQTENANSSESFASNSENLSQNDLNDNSLTCYSASHASPMPIQKHTEHELNGSCIKIDPDKVEDCLLELDAYLEEIDRDYALACAGSTHNSTICLNNNNNNVKSMKTSNTSPTNLNSLEKLSKNRIDCLFKMDNSQWCHNDDESTDASTMLMTYKDNNSNLSLNNEHFRKQMDHHQSNDTSDNCIDDNNRSTSLIIGSGNSGASNLRKTFSSSDIQMNQCGQIDDDRDILNGSRYIVNSKRKSHETAYNQQLKRGHKLRNTIAVFGQNDQSIESNDEASTSSLGKCLSFSTVFFCAFLSFVEFMGSHFI